MFGSSWSSLLTFEGTTFYALIFSFTLWDEDCAMSCTVASDSVRCYLVSVRADTLEGQSVIAIPKLISLSMIICRRSCYSNFSVAISEPLVKLLHLSMRSDSTVLAAPTVLKKIWKKIHVRGEIEGKVVTSFG